MVDYSEDISRMKGLLSVQGLKERFVFQGGQLPVQVLWMGQLAIFNVPAEFTTMDGRRHREDESKVVGSALTGGPNFIPKLEHSTITLAKSLQHGSAVESNSNKADHQANGDLSTQMTVDRCFYIYDSAVIHSTLRTKMN
ncbi:hypothetical protein Nepgr_003037 [Nepenthes gracilis]|uniref:Uncharacterized protein n=1 Tax=Nepenthes gracilis TaxID=150966 RepID=A0AAD3XCT4_NEPGR|nr:hypothetical protein Nepgr_003037 [Nepenthes gracilis]